MNTSPIVTIMRREVRETLSDWRIVTPILLLTFILPQLLVAPPIRWYALLVMVIWPSAWCRSPRC